MAATNGFYGRPRPALSNATTNASANGFYCGYTPSRNSYALSPSTPPSSLPPDSNPRLECLSQKIDDVMKTFDSHQKENKELRDEINALKGLIQEGRTSARKKKIPSSLSDAVRSIHERCEENMQFDASQLYRCEKNQDTKEYLINQVNAKAGDTYSPEIVKRAIHRYYESRRRLFNDEQPNRREAARETKSKSRKTAFRKQLYDRRKKYLKKKEEENWSVIDYRYMTEESGDEGCDVVRQHKLVWRSEELNRLIKKLDKRWRRKCSAGGWRFKPKERELSTPSTSLPPNEYAEWAVTI